MKANYQIDFELYKAFYVVARTGSITLAAQQLYLTQPSVTKQIQKLERDLGCRLFWRTKTGVGLTAEGQVLMRRIEPACQMFLSAEKEMASLQSLEQGTISIMSTEMGFKSYVLPVLEDFTKRHPNIRIRFSSDLNTHMMIDTLANGSIDAVVMHEPFQKESFMELRVIEHMEEYAVCGRRFRALAAAARSPAELLSVPFVSMPEGSQIQEYLARYFARHGLSFQPDIELTTVDLTAQAVEHGLGIGILPERLAKPEIEAGKLFRIPLRHPLPVRDACLITNRKLPPGLAAQALIREFRSVP